MNNDEETEEKKRGAEAARPSLCKGEQRPPKKLPTPESHFYAEHTNIDHVSANFFFARYLQIEIGIPVA